MVSDDAVELSNRRLVLTVAETMRTLNMTETVAADALTKVHESFPAETQLLFVILTTQLSAASTATTTTLCVGEAEADKVLAEAAVHVDGTPQKHLYGLQRLAGLKTADAAMPAQAVRPIPHVRLLHTPQLRTYPLSTREAVEHGEHAPMKAATAPPPPLATASPAAANTAAVKHEEAKSEGVSVKAEAPSLPATTHTSTQPSAATAMPFAIKTEKKETAAATVVPRATEPMDASASSEPSPAGATAVPTRRQASLFDMVMGGRPRQSSASATTVNTTTSASTDAESSSTKRPRTASPTGAVNTPEPTASAPAAKKKKSESAAKAPKAPKKTKAVETHSLAKLAKASAKAAASTTAAAKSKPTFDFDEEATDSDAETEMHDGDGFLSRDAFNEEVEVEFASALDVAVTAVNDEIILCDDAAPLAFQEPVKVPTAATTTVPRHAGSARVELPQSANRPPQRQLSAFFNPDVVALQNQYTKEVQTDMREENGAYICTDVLVYRHKETGEVISEETFHQLSADLIARQAEAAAAKAAKATSESPSENSPTKDAGVSGSSPAAGMASNAGKRSQKIKVAKPLTEKDEDAEAAVEKPAQRPTRNLLSFFKQ